MKLEKFDTKILIFILHQKIRKILFSKLVKKFFDKITFKKVMVKTMLHFKLQETRALTSVVNLLTARFWRSENWLSLYPRRAKQNCAARRG